MRKESSRLTGMISLIIIFAASFLLAGSELFDFDLSDPITKILGVIDLAALAALVCSMFRKSKAKGQNE